MTTIRAFIKRYPLLSFYTLAFAISWGAIFLVVGLGPGGSRPPRSSSKRLSPTPSPRWSWAPVWQAFS